MKRREKGIATLAVVSGIVMVGALFSFAVMQMSINETKKNQNLIVKGNEKAHARAAIDCAVAVFSTKNLDPKTLSMSDFDECKVADKTDFTLTPPSEEKTYWTLTAAHGFAKASVLISSGATSFSTFKTSGSLNIIGGQNWEAVTGNEITIENDKEKYVECTVIVAGGSVTIDVEYTEAEFTTSAPFGKKCAPTYSTVIVKRSGAVSDGFEKDILTHQGNIDIFKDLFGVPKDEWKSIRDQFKFKVITTGSAISNKDAVTNCGNKIKEALTAGEELIWVDGDCMLNGLTDTGSADQSPLIVIKNGIVGVNGNFHNFKGTIFQFTVDYPNNNLANSWGPKPWGNDQGICADGAMYSLCVQLIGKWGYDLEKWATLSFYLYGSFITDGGYLIDIPNTTAYFNGSYVLGYDDGIEDQPILVGPPKVLKGSYHDF